MERNGHRPRLVDLRRLSFVLEALLDLLESDPRVIAEFGIWETQLGVEAKARRLQRARSARRTMEARATFEAAAMGVDLWASSILIEAGKLLCALGLQPFDAASETVHGSLSNGLVFRYVRRAAQFGGSPLDVAVHPSIAPKVGRRLVIPAHTPIWMIRQQLDEIERAAASPHERGQVDEEQLRRDARWYYELNLRRPPRSVSDLKRERHAAERHPQPVAECNCHAIICQARDRIARLLALP